MLSSSVAELIDIAKRLEMAVDGDDIAAVAMVREWLLAKSMTPLRVFDELRLYQPSKASSSVQFLECRAGLAPGDAQWSVTLARKLAAMPLTEAAWLAGTLTSGQVRAIVANVTKRTAELYRAEEAEVLGIIGPLDATASAKAMQSWSHHAQALVDDDPDKPPREDEFFHSETTAGRYLSSGSFADITGKAIATAIELADTDNPRDDDTRSAAQRRGEALGDVCNFYLDYRTRTAVDPDADAPKVPKKRNWPQLVAVTTTAEMHAQAGAQLLDGPHIDHQACETLSCTAQLLRLVLDEDGAVRSYEMMPATVTDALFGAIAARDQGCRWPGCHKKPIHCDVHHVHFQENGGLNTPCHCCLMCKFHHHRAAHDPNIRLVMQSDGTLHITHADGTTETTKPPIRQPGLPWN